MSTVSSFTAGGPPALRLFDPVAEPATSGPLVSPQSTLDAFFRDWMLPVVGKAVRWSPGTVQSYDEAIRYWVGLTPNNPLERISPYDCSSFSAGLADQEGRLTDFMAPNTVRKHCAAIQRVLNVAGPRVQHAEDDLRRFGAGLIAEPPWIERPKASSSTPCGDFTLDEIVAILKACKLMRLPLWAPGGAPAWWRGLIVFLCATGLRIGTAMRLEWSMVSPQQLLIPGAICKKGKSHVQYLHPAARAEIVPLRSKSPRVFSVDRWEEPGTQTWIQQLRRQLLELAGLPESRRFGFHGFRRHHATELFVIDELAARDSLNHSDVETTRIFYANHDRQVAKSLERRKSAIDSMGLFQHLDGNS